MSFYTRAVLKRSSVPLPFELNLILYLRLYSRNPIFTYVYYTYTHTLMWKIWRLGAAGLCDLAVATMANRGYCAVAYACNKQRSQRRRRFRSLNCTDTAFTPSVRVSSRGIYNEIYRGTRLSPFIREIPAHFSDCRFGVDSSGRRYNTVRSTGSACRRSSGTNLLTKFLEYRLKCIDVSAYVLVCLCTLTYR